MKRLPIINSSDEVTDKKVESSRRSIFDPPSIEKNYLKLKNKTVYFSKIKLCEREDYRTVSDRGGSSQ
jgi:hypothetical protein